MLPGVRTVFAVDGLDAVAVALDVCPWAAILDLGMPRMGGLDAAQRLQQRMGKNLPILIAALGRLQAAARRLRRVRLLVAKADRGSSTRPLPGASDGVSRRIGWTGTGHARMRSALPSRYCRSTRCWRAASARKRSMHSGFERPRALQGVHRAPGPREQAGAVACVLCGVSRALAAALDVCALVRAARGRSRGAARAACGEAVVDRFGAVDTASAVAPDSARRAPPRLVVSPGALPAAIADGVVGANAGIGSDRRGRDHLRRRRHRRLGVETGSPEDGKRRSIERPGAPAQRHHARQREQDSRAEMSAAARTRRRRIGVPRRPPERSRQPREPGPDRPRIVGRELREPRHRAPARNPPPRLPGAPSVVAKALAARSRRPARGEARERSAAARRARARVSSRSPRAAAAGFPERRPGRRGERRQDVAHGPYHRRRRRAPGEHEVQRRAERVQVGPRRLAHRHFVGVLLERRELGLELAPSTIAGCRPMTRRAEPKSSSTGRPSPRIRMLSGEMSRWKTSRRAAARARRGGSMKSCQPRLVRGRAHAKARVLQRLPRVVLHRHVGGPLPSPEAVHLDQRSDARSSPGAGPR